jgi:hypothetical protein
MYIDVVPNRQSPPAMLLRESYREHGKVKKRTLANLSKLPREVVERIRQALAGQALAVKETVCGAIYGLLFVLNELAPTSVDCMKPWAGLGGQGWCCFWYWRALGIRARDCRPCVGRSITPSKPCSGWALSMKTISMRRWIGRPHNSTPLRTDGIRTLCAERVRRRPSAIPSFYRGGSQDGENFAKCRLLPQ